MWCLFQCSAWELLHKAWLTRCRNSLHPPKPVTGLLSGISALPTRGHSDSSPTARPCGVRAAELGGTGQTAVPVPPQTVQHHPPTPAVALRSPTSQRSQGSPLCPGLFLPWESRVSSCRPTRHVASGCRSRSLISAWGSACGAGSCLARALFRHSQDRKNRPLGQRSLGGLWEQGPPVGTHQSPAQASIPVPVPPPAPHPRPHLSHPAAAHGLAPWDPPCARPLPEHPFPEGNAPGHRDQQWTGCQLLSGREAAVGQRCLYF